MKENSPIWARLAVIISAGTRSLPSARRDAHATSDLPNTMIRKVASTCSGCSTRIIGSNSMPTDTKNSTANASRSGRVSVAA